MPAPLCAKGGEQALSLLRPAISAKHSGAVPGGTFLVHPALGQRAVRHDRVLARLLDQEIAVGADELVLDLDGEIGVFSRSEFLW